jgi:hypothetical protein
MSALTTSAGADYHPLSRRTPGPLTETRFRASVE